MPAGTPDLALIALGPADISGAVVARQRYVKDPDFVASYSRVFKSGASLGHGIELSLENDIDVATSSAAAHADFVDSRVFISSKQGRAFLSKSVLANLKKDKLFGKATKVTFGPIRTLGVGAETFVQPVSVALGGVIRVPFVLSQTRVDRVLSWLIVVGQPAGKITTEDIGRLQRAVAGRITTALLPAITALPAVTGAAVQGQILTGSDGTWTNTPTSFTREWQRCDAAGANCAALAGATGTTYTLAPGDVGFTIRFAVAATNASGSSAPVVSAPTAVVTAAPPTP